MAKDLSPSRPGDGLSAPRRWVPKLIVADAALADAGEPAPMADDAVEAGRPDALAPLVEAPELVPSPEPIETSVIAEPDPEILEQARAQGYALGLADGARQREQSALQEAQELRDVMAGMARLRTELESALADEVLNLAISMARQIVREALALRPEAIVPVLRDALQVLPALDRQTVLHLHPDDATLVRPLLDQDPELAQTTWKIVEDGRMERGGCRLETPESEVDATLSARWARVLAALGREDSWHADKAGV